jgi:hypothetical protein
MMPKLTNNTRDSVIIDLLVGDQRNRIATPLRDSFRFIKA